MNNHDRKILQAITGHPAPRDLAWEKFVALWTAVADEVHSESGDRLSVSMNGHRAVFHRQHNGTVSIEDIENARKLLEQRPDLNGAGHGRAVVIDAREARLYDFDFHTEKTTGREKEMTNSDTRSHHLRTVERHTGKDDEADLVHFLDEVATAVVSEFGTATFVVFGHGSGKSDVGTLFVERFAQKESEHENQIVRLVDIDLSAATDSDLEQATQSALAQPR